MRGWSIFAKMQTVNVLLAIETISTYYLAGLILPSERRQDRGSV
jgi:hypothetical protein